MLDQLQGRGVRLRNSGGPVIRCPSPGCEGQMYQVQEGELLQRSPRPGMVPVVRACRCPECGLDQKIMVQVRA